jgi:hypothetical protein
MTDTTVVHPSPHRHRVSFAALMFGIIAAPVFWLGQMILGYGVSAVTCYGGDHPTTIASGAALRSALIVFDAIAIIAAIAGGIVSYMSWRRVRNEKEGGPRQALEIGDGRARFMALWGIMSSLWFLGAIVFSTIASVTVPLCIR